MARRPARMLEPLIALIADPRQVCAPMDLRAIGRAGTRHPRIASARLTQLGLDEITEELDKLAVEIKD